jgi:uncharacterized protein with FMN-binding domain
MAKKYYPIKKQPYYTILLSLSITCSIGAILTLIPNPLAGKPNILGYFSFCPFTPAATFFCCLLAGLTCMLRAIFFKKDSRGNHAPFKGHLFALIPALLFAGAGIFSTLIWTNSSRQFSANTVTEITATLPAGLQEGLYIGKWYAEDITAEVELSVAGGKVVRGRLVSGRNVPARIAEAMFSALIDKQSLAVDAISGATASCSVVLKACEQALRGERWLR